MTDLPSGIVDAQEAHPFEDLREAALEAVVARVPPLKESLSELELKVFGVQAGFFYLPIAVADEWGASRTWCRNLGVALAVGHAHFALQDVLVDAGGLPGSHALQLDVFLLVYLDLLESLGTPVLSRTELLGLHYRYYADYCSVLSTELARRSALLPFDEGGVSELGLKAAPGNVVLHVLAEVTSRSVASEPLVRAVTNLCTAFQLQDDLCDLADDLADGVMTVPSTLAAERILGWPTGPLALNRARQKEIIEAVFLGGVAEAVLRLAGAYLSRASMGAQGAGSSHLVTLIEICQRRLDAELLRLASEKAALGIRRAK